MAGEVTKHTLSMNQAVAALTRAGVRFQQPTPFQLKVGSASYYPSKGTIFCDGEIRARDERGIAAFLRLLRHEGLADPDASLVCVADDLSSIFLDVPDDDYR
jgi:hypothetical protein